MPSTGDVILYGKTSDNDSPKLHVYNSSATSWQKECEISALCKHKDTAKILPVTIKGQEYFAISCWDCKKIRLYNMKTKQITIAFHDPSYYPGWMCQGDMGHIYIVSFVTGSLPILQLDCSHPQFSLIKTIQSGMNMFYAICYIPTHRLIAVSDNKESNKVRAVSCDTESTVWQLMGRVDGVECNPLGMMYSPQHDTLLIADGNNCRVLVLNSHDGSVRQVIGLRKDMGDIWEISSHMDQILIHHLKKNRKLKISYFSIQEQ